MKKKISKCNIGSSITKKLQSKLPVNALLTIYKSFIRPHLDYGDIVYDQLLMTLLQKTGKGSVQCYTSNN